MKVVIIEDEQITANSLIACINEVRPSYTVVKLLASVAEAVEYFQNNNQFDLLFSDVQLGDGLGFEIFKRTVITKPVIFCTAYDNYALEAFNANGIGYILKPFDARSVQTAIEKFEKLIPHNNDPINQLLDYLNKPVQLANDKATLVYQNEKIIPIPIPDIAMVYLSHGLTRLLTFNNRVFLLAQSLEDFENENGQLFFRANRQFLVHRKVIKDVSQFYNRKLVINLTIPFPEQILVSKERSPVFLQWLAGH